MRRYQIALLVGVFFTTSISNSVAADYIKLTGSIENLSNMKGEIGLVFLAQGQSNGPALATAEIKNNENFTAFVPKNMPLDMAFFIFDTPSGSRAGWKRSETFVVDETLKLTIPAGINISGRVVDAQNKPLGGVNVIMDQFNDPTDSMQISNNGKKWNGYMQGQRTTTNSDGSFALFSYATSEVKFERFFTVVGGTSLNFSWSSPKFLVQEPKQFLVCVPINFGETRTLSDGCSEDQATQALRISKELQEAMDSKVATLKSKFSEFKLEIDELMNKYPSMKSELTLYKNKASLFDQLNEKNLGTAELNLAGLTSKLTSIKLTYVKIARGITCVKGKKTLKIVDVKPMCPAGYKVKK